MAAAPTRVIQPTYSALSSNESSLAPACPPLSPLASGLNRDSGKGKRAVVLKRPRMKRFAFTTLFASLLLTSSIVQAEPWKGEGLNWKHSSGWSIQVPANAEAKVDTKPDDSVSVSSSSKDYLAVFRAFNDKADADRFEAALRKAIVDSKMTLQPRTAMDSDDWKGMVSEGGGKTEDLELELHIGQLVKGERYLVFMTTSDKGEHKTVFPIIEQIIKGVHSKS